MPLHLATPLFLYFLYEKQDRDYLCGKNEVIGFPHPHMSNGLDVPIKKYFYEGSLRS